MQLYRIKSEEEVCSTSHFSIHAFKLLYTVFITFSASYLLWDIWNSLSYLIHNLRFWPFQLSVIWRPAHSIDPVYSHTAERSKNESCSCARKTQNPICQNPCEKEGNSYNFKSFKGIREYRWERGLNTFSVWLSAKRMNQKAIPFCLWQPVWKAISTLIKTDFSPPRRELQNGSVHLSTFSSKWLGW